MEVGPDALPVGPCGAFLLQLFGWYGQKLQADELISLIVYDQANHVPYAQNNKQGRIHLQEIKKPKVFSKLDLKTTGMNLQGSRHIPGEGTSTIVVGKF